jgi:hypothetical protein
VKATLLADKLTQLTPLDSVRALREGYRRVVGRWPTDATLAVHVAQSALETGRWKSLHWHNFGNVKSGPNYDGFYCQFRCNEIIDGVVRWFVPPHPQTNFRAYLTANDGAEAHMRFLQALKRYALAWGEAERGDPDAFVVALKQAGYFTAMLEPYRKAVKSLWGEFMRVIRDNDLDEVELMLPPAQPEEPTHSPMSDADMAERLPLVYLEVDWDELRAARDKAVRGDD